MRCTLGTDCECQPGDDPDGDCPFLEMTDEERAGFARGLLFLAVLYLLVRPPAERVSLRQLLENRTQPEES